MSAPRNGWMRFPGGKRIELALPSGAPNDVVKPGGVRDDGVVTIYVGQTGAWRCIAIDTTTPEDTIIGVGRGGSLDSARKDVLGR